MARAPGARTARPLARQACREVTRPPGAGRAQGTSCSREYDTRRFALLPSLLDDGADPMPTEAPVRAGTLRTAALTTAALIGFAANSLLCRMALQPRLVDAASFTTIRILSGAVALLVLVGLSCRAPEPAEAGRAGSWGSAAILFVYAAAFSFAYLRIGAGVGALLLFGAVQATMLAAALRAGERLRGAEWTGLVAALGGLGGLVLPGLTAPDPAGAGLMIAAGVAWGLYSLRGRNAARPLAVHAANLP